MDFMDRRYAWLMKNSRIPGAVLGLAVGDAMGHTVDAQSIEEICETYGPDGLLGYDLANGYADVTSYTQIFAFTANGLLVAETHRRLRGRAAPLARYVSASLREWARSQQYSAPARDICWLSRVPELKRRFCMDTGILDALSRETLGTLDSPAYRSAKPSVLTEALAIAILAPKLGLDAPARDRFAAECAAMTHGRPESWLAAGLLCRLYAGVLETDAPLHELIDEARGTLPAIFGSLAGQAHRLWEPIQLAQTMAASGRNSREAMCSLGCATAAEALAGAVYAVETCGGDFDTAMITSVNHSGRSCAVGAVTGAILGARLGEEALPDFYLGCLEPAAALRELARDCRTGCTMGIGSGLFDDDWDRKYLHAGQA